MPSIGGSCCTLSVDEFCRMFKAESFSWAKQMTASDRTARRTSHLLCMVGQFLSLIEVWAYRGWETNFPRRPWGRIMSSFPREGQYRTVLRCSEVVNPSERKSGEQLSTGKVGDQRKVGLEEIKFWKV